MATQLKTQLVEESDIAAYERDGAVCLRGLFDHSWVTRLREAVERRMDEAQSSSNESPNASFTDLFLQDDPAFRSFAHESPAAAIAKAIMRSTTSRFYFDQLFVKEPSTQKPSGWHHDAPFWPVAGDQICSIWLALDPVTKASSGLEYVAGSHRWGRRFQPPGASPALPGFDDDEATMPDIEGNRSSYTFLNWDMEPGDCLVHHGLTVHGAGANTTINVRRRALATRWAGDDIVYRAGGGYPPLRVEGLASGAELPEARFPAI